MGLPPRAKFLQPGAKFLVDQSALAAELRAETSRCMCMCVCVCVLMCMHVHVSIYWAVCGDLYVCVHACMYVCQCICVYRHALMIHTHIQRVFAADSAIRSCRMHSLPKATLH